MYVRFEDLLVRNATGKGVEVAALDADGLLEERCGLQIAGVWDNGVALSAVLRRNVPADSTALEEDETIVVDVGDLAERLFLEEGRGLVLALGEVDGDELILNVLLLQCCGDAASAGGDRVADKFENHGWRCGSGELVLLKNSREW